MPEIVGKEYSSTAVHTEDETSGASSPGSVELHSVASM
jgi:hypothetical protein